MNISIKGMNKDLHNDGSFPQNELKKVKIEDGTLNRRKIDDDYDADSFDGSANSDGINYQSNKRFWIKES